MMRFHLDEHIPQAVAAGLRKRGVDVTTTAEAGLLSADDTTQLAFATQENRVLVTHDADFLRLARGGQHHTGIAYCAPGEVTLGELVGKLCLMNDCLSDGEMTGRVEYL